MQSPKGFRVLDSDLVSVFFLTTPSSHSPSLQKILNETLVETASSISSRTSKRHMKGRILEKGPQ